ncbi:MAG: ribose-phosphate diphosphokinase [Alphaproteobacteria bacterium]
MTKIIAGSSSKKLAQQLSTNLNIAQVEAFIERFEDEELRVQLADGVHEEDVIIVQSTSKPANDHLMELLLLVDAAKRSGARRVIALVPYFGYSRQDRPSYAFGPISARLVATLIEAAGVDHLITLDLHSQQAEGFFQIGVQNIETLTLFADLLKSQPNLMVVSPDIGGMIRARKLSSLLGVDLAVINKIRTTHNTCQMGEIIGNVAGKNCVLVDDIVDTGGTLCKAAALLMQHGALSVEAIATHAVLSGQAVANIEASVIKKITVTGTIEQTQLPAKFAVADISVLLGKNLKRMIKS